MIIRQANDTDLQLISEAQRVISERFDGVLERHTVAACVRTESGRLISGVNVFANCGYGPCAEAVVIGLAATLGETKLCQVVAVGGPDHNFPILSPCGNCRQLLFEYFPEIEVVVEVEGKPVVTTIASLLPFSYKMEL
jgi:cytidine deaminase